jgi:hypothetical protein
MTIICRTLTRGAASIGGMAIVSVLALAAASSAATPPSPPGHGPIQPNQQFGALINGNNGAAGPVTIKMACFGPIRPGQTGHPMSGQTLTVFRPEAIRGTFGNTGPRGHSIGAFFGPPPPSASPVASQSVLFHRYVTKALPSSLNLPCGGSGNVTFVPLPMSPGEVSVSVPVNYSGQP